MPFILQTSGLSKKIGSKALVTDVNIHIPKGEIYGFLGPNGAGKTTVMKMITNLWKPTSGTIEVFGEVLTPKSYEVLKRMGSIIEFPTFYDHMTGRENLQLHCEYMGYYNVDSVESALQMLDLTSAADQPVKNYSLGMKERLGIARAIMCKPELLILDEPTNGLDPAGMKQIRDLLKTLCSEYGITVMISSHILSEVESIADTVAIIHHGKMMKEIRMNLMFSYPIKRQKILVSQMLAVWIFNFVALVLTKLLIYGCILLGSQFMVSSFPLDYNMASMGFYIQLLLKSVVIVTMSFIALFIGMAMKSSKATIVSSFLLIFLTQANVGDFSLADNAILPVVLMILSLIFAFLSIYNVETKDLN